ncbi:AB hydrolase superfamily protein YdjP [Cladorrhinum samala]|uniref:AB hydrolase superfamily protein YdjP n=1 Tax=Cladorrhinum samala TaxID=585594 RepID=A0AAV9HFQ6_9PEZI|nr:AB hydrolase superfamily protein YdjP [Cladorrhinum samala]
MADQHQLSFSANDGTHLSYQSSLAPNTTSPPPKTLIILLHGFSGSSSYFTRNFVPLTQDGSNWVVAPDMRGHGASAHTRGGYHVARLASDLRDLLSHLSAAFQTPLAELKIVPVGCSIGAAILWTYIELFGDSEFAGFIFVDQAPLQDRSRFDGWDETKAHRGCYDEKTTLAAQEAWISRPEQTYKGLVEECLGYRYKPDPERDQMTEEQAKKDEEFFTAISRQCDARWLARLLSDHTRYDHREACEAIAKPTLVMAGRRSGCFSLEGLGETVERIKRGNPGLEGKAKMSVFESGHWLFYEEPQRFHKEVLDFVHEMAK